MTTDAATQDVIVPTGEQEPVEESHDPAAAVVPAEGNAGEQAAVDGAASDAGTVEPVGETDPESLDAVFERYPTLREQYDAKIRERENAGAQRREAQLKRDAGKKDSTRQNVTRFLAENGVNVEDTGKLDYLYDLAAANSAYELAQAVPEAVLSGFTVPVEARERAIEAREAGDWDGYVSTLVTAAAEEKVKALRAEDERRNSAEVQRLLAAEIKARGLEAAPVREGAPPRPVAAAAPVTDPRQLDGEAYEQWKRDTPPAEQAAAWQRVGQRAS